MRFITAFVSLIAASSVVAGPIVRAPVALEAGLVERQLCQVGVPCFVQAEVNNALNFMNTAVAILQGPMTTVVVNVQASVTILVIVAAQLKTDVEGLTDEAAATLEAQVVAAIKVAVSNIKADVALITNGVAVVNTDLQVALSAVLSAIVAIEAVVGSCT